MLRTLPESLDLRTATLVEPTSVAWHAVARGGDVAGKRVLVIGAGPIGALIIAVLRCAGAAEIIAVDLHDLPLANARRLGATRPCTPARPTRSRESRPTSRWNPAAAPPAWAAPSAARRVAAGS